MGHSSWSGKESDTRACTWASEVRVTHMNYIRVSEIKLDQSQEPRFIFSFIDAP